MSVIRQAFPSRAIGLLLLIGLVDLVATAVLHAQGAIVEMNPLMRGFIDRSEWLFVLVKGATLVGGWYLLARFARTNHDFVRKACLAGSIAYIAIWVIWFFKG